MNKFFYPKALILLVFLFSMVTHVKANEATNITDGYIKESIPGSDITAAYMTLHNTSNKVITLQKITSLISDRIEIHEHSMANGMMRMRQVEDITIKAHNNVVLQPSGLHLMIFDLKKRLNEKDVVPLTLHFSNDTKINIQLPVYRYK